MMGRLKFEAQTLLVAFAEAFNRAADSFSLIYNFLASWRVNRLGSRTRVKHELRATRFAKTLDGKTPSEFAPFNHNHDEEYYKAGETVEYARGIYKDGVVVPTEELAPVNHTHSEYARRGQFQVAAKRLDGLAPTEFAPKIHEHPEYLRIDEIVDAAEVIGGLRYSDFAQVGHSHSDEYYRREETVDDALYLVDPQDPNKLYAAEDFAPREHNHPEYYTVQEFMKLFLLREEPYWVSDELELTVVDVEAGSLVSIGSDQAIYELLQSPYTQVAMRPAAVADTVVKKSETKRARVIFIRNVGVGVGRFISLNVQVPSSGSVNILGVFPAVKASSATEKIPVQIPVIGAYNGSTVVLYAPPFRSASVDLMQSEVSSGSVLVDLMVIAECTLREMPRKIGVVKS